MKNARWGRFKCVACEKVWRHPNAGAGPLAVPSLCEDCRKEPKEPREPPEILENPFALEYEI